MLAGNFSAGTLVAIAATLSNTQFDQALDVAAEKGAGRHILEGRDAPAVIQRRLALNRPDDEGGHLVTGHETLGAIVTLAATAGDIQLGCSGLLGIHNENPLVQLYFDYDIY